MTRSLLALVVLVGCSEYNIGQHPDKVKGGEDGTGPSDGEEIGSCEMAVDDLEDVEVGITDICIPVDTSNGGFEPIVEWSAGQGKSSHAVVAVADLNGDNKPEIVANFSNSLLGAGELVVLDGHGTELWSRNARLGYASSPVVADLDADGEPEILAIRETKTSFGSFNSEFAVVAYDAYGTELFETQSFKNKNFDYATGISVSDMDHDGSPEIVAGRVIFNWNGTVRGVGAHGRGAWSGGPITEASLSAVTDLDLDGLEEVITGNAIYDADGNTLWHDPSQSDGMVAIANLDNDPEGEFVASSSNTLRAVDTDGSILWGPIEIPSANILAPAAIADVDLDGRPEIITAGGNKLKAFNHDGTVLWTAQVTDMSGASGASIFDFEGDGIPEVVYIDETEMVAYDGATGTVKFHTSDHASATMMDYPVIADVDADGRAEIVVAHSGHGRAISVYGDAQNSWTSARRVWNQHAYSINNVHDDLSVPVDAVPNFVDHNTWHSAIDDHLLEEGEIADLEAEIVDTCVTAAACASDSVMLAARILNKGADKASAGIPVSLYAISGADRELVDTVETRKSIQAGFTGEIVTFEVPVSLAENADRFEVVADDEGTGHGIRTECSEDNNSFTLQGPFCQ